MSLSDFVGNVLLLMILTAAVLAVFVFLKCSKRLHMRLDEALDEWNRISLERQTADPMTSDIPQLLGNISTSTNDLAELVDRRLELIGHSSGRAADAVESANGHLEKVEATSARAADAVESADRRLEMVGAATARAADAVESANGHLEKVEATSTNVVDEIRRLPERSADRRGL